MKMKFFLLLGVTVATSVMAVPLPLEEARALKFVEQVLQNPSSESDIICSMTERAGRDETREGIEQKIRKSMPPSANEKANAQLNQLYEKTIQLNVDNFVAKTIGPQAIRWRYRQNAQIWRIDSQRGDNGVQPPEGEGFDFSSICRVDAQGNCVSLTNLQNRRRLATLENPTNMPEVPNWTDLEGFPTAFRKLVRTILIEALVADGKIARPGYALFGAGAADPLLGVDIASLVEIIQAQPGDKNRKFLFREESIEGNGVAVTIVTENTQLPLAKILWKDERILSLEMREPLSGKIIFSRSATDFDGAGHARVFTQQEFDSFGQLLRTRHVVIEKALFGQSVRNNSDFDSMGNVPGLYVVTDNRR